jgi:hypothetical protein
MSLLVRFDPDLRVWITWACGLSAWLVECVSMMCTECRMSSVWPIDCQVYSGVAQLSTCEHSFHKQQIDYAGGNRFV